MTYVPNNFTKQVAPQVDPMNVPGNELANESIIP